MVVYSVCTFSLLGEKGLSLSLSVYVALTNIPEGELFAGYGMVGHVGVPVVGRTVCFAFPSINQSRNPPVDDKTPSPTVMSVAALYRSLLERG